MPRVLSDRQTTVWLFLIAATVLTAVLGLEQHGASQVVGLLLLVIAFIKVRLVAMHFMEVRDAPLSLRLIVEAYVGVVFVVLSGIYLLA
ncbi:MAG: cytochrome C oxidase subunit IV family protein [Marmoricola sp.]